MIIGYDARHNSDIFASDTAEIMAGAGFEAMIVARAAADAGASPSASGTSPASPAIVVTASHNPPQDNGYKVYLGDGSQIVPPADAEIAARIDEVAEHRLERRAPGSRPIAVLGRRTRHGVPGPARRAGARPTRPASSAGSTPRCTASAARSSTGPIATGGFDAPAVVAEQAAPDPDFPTVAFPNPEEPGAIDLALALAEEQGADLVVANDPDADRCAVAAPIDGRWRMLRGDELGCLLGDDALRRGVRGTYACSIVSSSLLSAMAAAYAQPFVYTLTGFKWIGRVPGLAYGYEEAIGYCVDPEAVPDKDGISALIRVLTLAAGLKAAGLTVADRLDEITRTLRRLRDRSAGGAGRRPRPDRRGHGPASRATAGRAARRSPSPSSTWRTAAPTCRPPTVS